jgi:hypothetical protein
MGLLSFIRSNRRVGAILTVCQDFRRGKGGKPDAAPRHPDLDVCLREHIDGAGLTSNPKAPLFLSCGPAGRLAGNRLPRTFSSQPRPTSPARVTSSVASRASAILCFVRRGRAATPPSSQGECAAFVGRLRRSGASLRRLRRDCVLSARQLSSMSFW